MLSVEGEDESRFEHIALTFGSFTKLVYVMPLRITWSERFCFDSPFFSTCFLLPMLCQITMKAEGCKLLAASRGYIAVSYWGLYLLYTDDMML